ncbi:MAG: LysM peptidoglycan-binding domain-containing protein [Bacteroidota bacterium]|nr:LysM peptidoglycan-binding domain-containing protein [Bacteroidota bacterium]
MAGMEKTYTVGTWARNRDCLWNISKKKTIYDNPFMWPKIWQGNRDQIKDPDIIHPGQKLKIPVAGPLTDNEKKAEHRYWRKKHAAQQQASAQ